ncbi:hypothetical protein QIA20_05615 (plasmid) [Borreliella japonica]
MKNINFRLKQNLEKVNKTKKFIFKKLNKENSKKLKYISVRFFLA